MQRFSGFFLLDSQTRNKISVAAAFCLPTSKVVGNMIDWDLKRYTTLKNLRDRRNILISIATRYVLTNKAGQS
jgi:hypothetical protein